MTSYTNESVNKVIGRYSTLFTLPSHLKIIILLFGFCMISGFSSIFPFNPSFFGFTSSALFGLAFFIITLSADIIIKNSFMKNDPIFNLRRCSALSLFSSLFWFVFIFLGSVLSGYLGNPNIWVKLFLLGFSVTLILRLLVFLTVSFTDRINAILSSSLQPVFCNILLFFAVQIVGYKLNPPILLFLFSSILIAISAIHIFIITLNRVGEKKIGVPSISLFKAFLANWIADLNAPLEFFLEKFGYEQDIKLSLLAFRAKKEIKAIIVVPTFHPGPFKNIGSSPLPYIIQKKMEDKLQCIVSIPHGISGHELNLTSQLQNQKVLRGVLDSLNFSNFSSKSSPFLRARVNEAISSCQIFGNCAVISLTIAPQTMEDLPRELDSYIVMEAEKRGLKSTIIIDAHNSIEGEFNPEDVVDPLGKAALASLDEALLYQQVPFEVGAAKVVPKEFGVEEGMGPGGISVLVVKVNDQKTAYITIDGNNMVSGLREKILQSLKDIGILDGEVLTTDTHMVNGVVLTKRGYHPVGEAIDYSELTDYIKKAVIIALNDLEPVEASWSTTIIPNIKVMGNEQIETLSRITEETAKLSKKQAIPIFSITSVFLIALLVLL